MERGARSSVERGCGLAEYEEEDILVVEHERHEGQRRWPESEAQWHEVKRGKNRLGKRRSKFRKKKGEKEESLVTVDCGLGRICVYVCVCGVQQNSPVFCTDAKGKVPAHFVQVYVCLCE